MYRSWPTGVQELLRATFPGVIRQIRRNFFNLVSLSEQVKYQVRDEPVNSQMSTWFEY